MPFSKILLIAVFILLASCSSKTGSTPPVAYDSALRKQVEDSVRAVVESESRQEQRRNDEMKSQLKELENQYQENDRYLTDLSASIELKKLKLDKISKGKWWQSEEKNESDFRAKAKEIAILEKDKIAISRKIKNQLFQIKCLRKNLNMPDFEPEDVTDSIAGY